MSKHKLVPVKPTEEMMRAIPSMEDLAKVWKAMLEAAPQEPPVIQVKQLVW